ncbi:MAG: hypothetical protein WBA77_09965 [Microcoleaceae cyanobacterium]
MTEFKSLPKEEDRRRAILVLSNTDVEDFIEKPGGYDIIQNRQISLLDISTQEKDNLVDKLREDSNLLNPGNLLIQSPYNPSEYKPVDQAYSSFSLEKFYHFTTLCGYLGATEVLIEQIEIETKNKELLFEGTLEALQSDGELAVKKGNIGEISKFIQLKHEFYGGKPNIDEAEAYLGQYRLRGDISMKSLIDQRKFGGLKSREMILALSDNVVNTLEIVTDINVPIYTKLKAKIDRVKQESYSFTMKINVKFSDELISFL